MNEPASIGIDIRLRRSESFTLDASLRLPGTGISVLFGHSGSGKTTLLRVLAGLERVPGARVTMGDQVWQDDARGLFVPPERRRIGMVFQDARLFPHLTVRENLHYGLDRLRPALPARSFDDTVALLNLGALLQRGVSHLSGGERQRVAIARALLSKPCLMLLDEPLASLDQGLKSEVLPYLERLHEELRIPIVYVTHSPAETLRLADHLVLLGEGRVLRSAPLAEALSGMDLPEALREEFGNVMEGSVVSHDSRYGLLTLAFGGGLLRIPHRALPQGTRLRVRIKASDITVAVEQTRGTSMLNAFTGMIDGEFIPDGAAHMLVRIRVGTTPLIARLTRLSHDQLGLHEGRTVWAMVKSVAVDS
jgi:molybdate transport system ATP-binding protein